MAMTSWDANSATPPPNKVQSHPDHQVLYPPETLKELACVPARRGDPTEEDIVGQAETNLGEIAADFGSWMIAEIDALAEARAKFHALRKTGEARRALFQAAHTVRGDAGVFGFPLAGRVADSLAKLLDGCPPALLSDALIDQHVDAIRAIVREGARNAAGAQARELTAALIEVTSQFLPTGAPLNDAA